jgi:hypothetical protein
VAVLDFIEAATAQGSFTLYSGEVGWFRRPQGWVRCQVEAGHDPFVRVTIRQQYA